MSDLHFFNQAYCLFLGPLTLTPTISKNSDYHILALRNFHGNYGCSIVFKDKNRNVQRVGGRGREEKETIGRIMRNTKVLDEEETYRIC